MPFHWCQQETEALLLLLSMVPLVGLYIKRLHAKWHLRHHTKCDHANDGHNHGA